MLVGAFAQCSNAHKSSSRISMANQQAAGDDPQFPVELWVYDLTNGMARALSPMLLGTQVREPQRVQGKAAVYLFTWQAKHVGQLHGFSWIETQVKVSATKHVGFGITS
jgi:hypothetical protein